MTQPARWRALRQTASLGEWVLAWGVVFLVWAVRSAKRQAKVLNVM